MGFAEAGIAATNASDEMVKQAEFTQLAVNAIAITAGDQAEVVVAREKGEHAASARQEFRSVTSVVRAPDLVRGIVFGARQICSAIYVVPVRGIMLLEFGDTPWNLHFGEHRQICGGVGGVGIEQSAVPIEEDALQRGFG